MMYLPLDSAQLDLLDALCYGIARPWHTRDTKDTGYHAGGVIHPDTGQEALKLPAADEAQLLMHPEADVVAQVPQYITEHFTEANLSPLAALKRKIAQWYSQAAADEMEATWEANKGTRIRSADFLADSIVAEAKTRSEMEADGWFPEPTL